MTIRMPQTNPLTHTKALEVIIERVENGSIVKGTSNGINKGTYKTSCRTRERVVLVNPHPLMEHKSPSEMKRGK